MKNLWSELRLGFWKWSHESIILIFTIFVFFVIIEEKWFSLFIQSLKISGLKSKLLYSLKIIVPKVPDCVVCYCFFGQKTSQKMTMKDIYHKKRLWGPGEIIKNTALIHFHYVLRVWNEWVFVIFTINCQRIRSVIHQEQNFNFQNNKFQLNEYISAYRTLTD